MLHPKIAYVLLALIVVLFAVLGVLYAVNTPPWQAPDEPAHYNYIAQVAGHGCCPVIERSDWNAEQLEELKAAGFPDNIDVSHISYEDWQPPLYYLLLVPFFKATGGSLIFLRILSLIFGVVAILATFTTVSRIFPRHLILALTAAAFVAFIPQHIADFASINNDGLAEMLLAIMMVIAVGYVGNPTALDYEGKCAPYDESMRPHVSALGGMLGLIILTKLTPIIPAVVILTVAIAWRWRIEGRSARWLFEQVAWGFGLALLIALPWLIRNAQVYGFSDLLAMRAHESVVIGQPRTADEIASKGDAAYLNEYLTTTYHSFFGQFGWMGVPMQPRDYLIIGAFLIWGLIGLILINTRFHDLWKLVPQQRAAVWILFITLIVTIVVYAYYNLTFVQFQGRYLYGMLIPLGFLVASGAWGWVLLLRSFTTSKSVRRVLTYLPLVAIAWMPVLSVWALYRYVIPFLD